VSVFGSGVTPQGEPYLAMEYVDGCDAFRLQRRAGLEHRPLRLSVGILIARPAAPPRLGPHGGETPPYEGALMGKFSYLAPEQVAGEPFAHRPDLFSL